jgi:predicted acylesterase/phospholipase RssA
MRGLEEVWRSLDTVQVLLGTEPGRRTRHRVRAGMRLLMAVRRVARGQPSLYSDAGLRHLLAIHQGETTFAELRLPLRIIAADLTTGTRAVIGSGRVGDAILASSAMPGVFPPVCIDNHVYVDGGTLDNCSLETALALGARRIVVVDVGYDSYEEPSPLWCTELTPAALREHGGSMHAMAVVLQRMTQVVCRYQYSQALKRLPRGVELRFLCPGAGVAGSILDFDKAGQWIEQGYRATQSRLAQDEPSGLPVADVS